MGNCLTLLRNNVHIETLKIGSGKNNILSKKNFVDPPVFIVHNPAIFNIADLAELADEMGGGWEVLEGEDTSVR